MSGKVLLVDDDPQMRLAMRRVLSRAGYEVDEASDGAEAAEKLGRGAHPVVVTDVRMPRLDGMGFLARVREISPRTEVLMVTAYGTVASAVEAVRRGARDYLLKPFPPEVLERAVGEAMAAAAGSGGSETREILTRDPRMLRLIERARRAALSEATILIEAESGTGKELLARLVHESSPRREGPFVAINCAAFPTELLDSELFGHARGAFTGAVRDRRGHFEVATNGTLLLDEIAEMALPLQAKLLRVLQEREVLRLGEETPRKVDARVIAATNRDLSAAVREGRFREDLFFRLSVIPVRLPPLRERPDDIPLLVEEFCRLHGGPTPPRIGGEAMARLRAHPWPGNVRELENVVLRAVVLGRPDELGVGDFFPEEAPLGAAAPRSEAGGEPGAPAGWRGRTLGEAERLLIEDALRATGGNRTRAAALVGISVRTLRNKLREYRAGGDGKNLPTGT